MNNINDFSKKIFTNKDFTVIWNKPILEVGMKIKYYDMPGEIISLTGPNYGNDYCVIKLDKPDSNGCSMLEVLKSEFNYLTYPE